MSEPTKINSHYDEARALLPSQFYEKPFINAHLKAMADACQDVEDSFYNDLYINKFLVNAGGDDLEVIGNLYNVRRVLGEDDTTLRRKIGAEISRRNSEGTPNSVKSLLSSFTGLKNMRVFEHSTGCPIIYGETLDQSYELIGVEAQYVKDASPITTGSCVFGVSYSDQYSNAIIPAELDLTYYNLVVDGNCRDYFNFNGDGYIEAPRRWNPDAVDPSFVIEFYNDLSLSQNGSSLSQAISNSFSEWELATETVNGDFKLILGGSPYTVVDVADSSLGLWRLEYDSTAQEVLSYKDNVLVKTVSNVTLGISREPLAKFYIASVGGSNRFDEGIASDVKMWINGSTKETGTLVLDMPINDNSTTIKDYAPSEAGVLDGGSGEWIAVEGVGYQFDFNGDGNITFPRMWNPDAVDPSFTIEFYNNFNVVEDTRFLVQGLGGSFTTTELLLSIDVDGDLEIYLGALRTFRLEESKVPKGKGLWKIESTFSTGRTKFYFDNTLIVDSIDSNPIGTYRDNSSVIAIGASPDNMNSWIDGTISDVKLWINTETTNDLVLDAPINDNSNSIKNLAERESGILTEGTGVWEEICESEEKNLVTGSASESKNIVVRKSSDTLIASSADSQNAQLAEFTTTTDQFAVDVDSNTQDQLSMNTAGNILQVSFEGIENDRGVPVQTTQITINSTVEDIIAAFNEVAP